MFGWQVVFVLLDYIVYQICDRESEVSDYHIVACLG